VGHDIDERGERGSKPGTDPRHRHRHNPPDTVDVCGVKDQLTAVPHNIRQTILEFLLKPLPVLPPDQTEDESEDDLYDSAEQAARAESMLLRASLLG